MADEANVYFVSDATIQRVPVDGGTVTTMAVDSLTPEWLAQDTRTLYWTDESCPTDGGRCTGTVKKLSKP